jgi:CRP/FNR family transcriptional regulator, cyclic AMP receptor protein
LLNRDTDCHSPYFVFKEAPVGKPTGQAFDPRRFLTDAGAGKAILKLHKNQPVYAQGDLADAVFYLQKGSVKITVLSAHGKEAVVAILAPGQFFGEACLHGHPSRRATATAIEECLITCIAKAAMIAVLHDQPTFSELFMAYVLTRNSRLEEDLIDQMLNSTEKRLARLLLLLANFGGGEGRQSIASHVSQETLAEMIGTTRSRVSVLMNKFRKLGLISYGYNGAIEVHGPSLNAFLLTRRGASSQRPAPAQMGDNESA